MNYMKQIAEMLGLEIGEEFEFGDGFTYRLSEEGLEFRDDEWLEDASYALNRILTGEYEITRKPWKPKGGERYWQSNSYGTANESYWNGASFDLCYWKAGNCFRTQEEAEAKGKAIMEALMKEYEEA